MIDLKFSSNDNNKLNCEYFTTIRVFDEELHKVGRPFRIILSGKPMSHAARIRIVTKFYLKDLNEFMAYIDMGKPAWEVKDILHKMYRSNYYLEQTQMAFILLQKDSESIDSKAQQLSLEEFRDKHV